MNYQDEYGAFLEYHEKRRKCDCLRRLKEGHGHAEQLFLKEVWWPAIGTFDNLHPEYAVSDFKDGVRYIDFAYLIGDLRIAIEIDGYGPHVRSMSRWQFSDSCQRQNHLVIDGWIVLRFSYDDVAEKPRVCQQTIQQLMGRYLTSRKPNKRVTPIEKEIVRLASHLCRPITPKEVSEFLGVSKDVSRRYLYSLVEKRWMEPVGQVQRVRRYRLIVSSWQLGV